MLYIIASRQVYNHAMIVLCNRHWWSMQSIQGCYPGGYYHVGGASAVAAAAAGPAMELLTKLYFREVFQGFIHYFSGFSTGCRPLYIRAAAGVA